MVREAMLTEEEDEITWGLSSSKVLKTSSIYKLLTMGGVAPKLASKIWKCNVPLKIRIFLWQTLQNRIQMGQ
jgi:hypothetical protein